MIGMSIKRISVLNLCHVLKPFVKSTPDLNISLETDVSTSPITPITQISDLIRCCSRDGVTWETTDRSYQLSDFDVTLVIT